MNETSKDYFIKKVETENDRKKQLDEQIILNGIFSAAGIILGTIVYKTEGYPCDSQYLEQLSLACSFYMGISGGIGMIKGLCKKAQLNQNNNNQTNINNEIEVEKPKQYVK